MSSNFAFHTITLFPMMFEALNAGITGRAIANKHITLTHHNPRDYSDNRFGYVDDRPFGGGPGMVMAAPPIQNTIDAILSQQPEPLPVVFFSPHGNPLNQTHITHHKAEHKGLILLCGRYEGVDQRLIDRSVDYHYALGDCVISGGEIPAMYFIDALTRWLPGVLGNPESLTQDSFTGPLLDHAHYTRPRDWQGLAVPEVLHTGDHKAIAAWRENNAHLMTEQKKRGK